LLHKFHLHGLYPKMFRKTQVFIFPIGLIEILVFVVIHHLQHLLVNIIVVRVEKHFVQHVRVIHLNNLFFLKKSISIGSSKSSPLLEFGIEDEVRVCESCYDRLTT